MRPKLQRLDLPDPGRAAALSLLALASALGACAAPPRTPVSQTASSARLTMPTDQVLALDRSAWGTSEPARFEFSRRDEALSATRRVPLQATREWPTPARPTERRVIFRRWVQY
ncbi:MAG: hypothetical protein KDA20_12190 [Phycisphaerales bacterium]|nr:hypothetical protein [Phycisphaerales bacterium]